MSSPSSSVIRQGTAASLPGAGPVVSPLPGHVAHEPFAPADLSAVSAPTAGTTMARDAAGRAQVATPSAAGDIATKSYVDSQTSAGAVATADLAPAAVTPAKADPTGIKCIGAAGRNGIGAQTVTGAALGDRLAKVYCTTTNKTVVPGTDFALTATANAIAQLSAVDFSADRLIFEFWPPAS